MSVEVVFDEKDSMLGGNSPDSRLMQLVLFPNLCMYLYKPYKQQKYVYRMMYVYKQVVLEGLLVILVGLANEQQTKHKNQDICIAAEKWSLTDWNH